MKSYFSSILAWLSVSLFITIIMVPLIGGEGGAFLLSLSIILSPFFGITSNLIGKYVIEKLNINISNLFIIALIGSSIFFFFFSLLNIFAAFSHQLIQPFPHLKNIAIYLAIMWLFFWIIGGPIILLIDFLQKKNSLSE